MQICEREDKASLSWLVLVKNTLKPQLCKPGLTRTGRMSRLPQELLDMVAGYLPLGERVHVVANISARKWSVSQCASVSRPWQSSVERCTFRRLSVLDRDFFVLSTLLSTPHRINCVRFLTYQISVHPNVAAEWTINYYVRHKLWELLTWLSGLGMVGFLAKRCKR